MVGPDPRGGGRHGRGRALCARERGARRAPDLDGSVWTVRREVKPPFQVFQETPEGIAADMRRRRHRYAVALVEDVPVGTFRLTSAHSAKRGPYWLVSRLAVLPEFQGRHVAHRLIDWLHERAERHQVPELRGHVRTALPRLIRFYQQFGYRVLGYRSLPGYPKYLTVVARRLK